MGKRIEDLPLDDTPIETAPAPPVDARDTTWYRFVVEIEDLLATGEYHWAADTLEGIQASVERTRAVSEAQRQAVRNIEARSSRERTSRRYEGFRRYR